MLMEFGDDGSAYAGGTELLLAMRHGALRYGHLVDVKVLPGFDSIQLRDDWIEIGAGATHRMIEYSPIVRENLKVLAELESKVANIRVRASGTIGGNLCFAEPHSDPATLLLALDAVVTAAGPSGARELRVDELICGAYANSLNPGELFDACAGSLYAYRPARGLRQISDTRAAHVGSGNRDGYRRWWNDHPTLARRHRLPVSVSPTFRCCRRDVVGPAGAG